MTIAEKKLIEAGYKLTKPRLAILVFLAKASQPYSAQEIATKVKGIDLVSVYRNLTLFSNLDIVHEDIFLKEKKYCLADSPQHHIVCRLCGHTERIECHHDYFNKVNNFSDIKHQLMLSGVCNNCK